MTDNSSEKAKRGALHLIVFPTSEDSSIVRNRRHDQVTGIRKVGNAVFETRTSILQLERKTSENQYIVFRKRRGIARSREADYESGHGHVYALVTYRFVRPDSRVKKRVQRLVRKSLCVRLRPGVLLFPYLRAKDSRRRITLSEKEHLLSSASLTRILSSMGAEVHRWGRLEPLHFKDNELLSNTLNQAIMSELGSAESRIASLRSIISDPQVLTKRLWDRHNELIHEYQTLRLRFSVLERIWRHESKRTLKRIYNALLKVRREIENRHTKALILDDRKASVDSV